MKAGARFHVMRYSRVIGRETGPRRVVLDYYAWTLPEALEYARGQLRRRVMVYIVAAGQPAHRKEGQ